MACLNSWWAHWEEHGCLYLGAVRKGVEDQKMNELEEARPTKCAFAP